MKESTTYLRPHYLDASAMVKLVVDEEYSDRVRSYVLAPSQSWRLCTSYCFFESLNVLKAKTNRKELSDRGYIAGSRSLIRLVINSVIKLVHLDVLSTSGFAEGERLVKLHKIDFIDAFQVISIKNSWPQLAHPSRPLLVTADSGLSKAAEKEDIQVWFCRETKRPKLM
ncbi:MAG: hypothetical protein ABIP64_06440 [Burkholderiales bacterium]